MIFRSFIENKFFHLFRPGDLYVCSIVMFGNVGPTQIEFDNADPTILDLPGIDLTKLSVIDVYN